MSEHTISRIANVLEKQYGTLIDMNDWEGRPEDARRICFLQRALAALCVRSATGVDLSIAAKAVTDGFNDNGIDALHFDQNADTLYLVQTKWNESGNKPLDPDGMNAFVVGARDLLASRFDRFNDKVRAKEAEIRAVLYSERPIKFVLIAAHTATHDIPLHATRKLDDLIREMNDPVSVCSSRSYGQTGVYELITGDSKPAEIKFQVVLKDWGVIDKPFLAYYGRVHVNEIAQWWRDNGNELFGQNLRLLYESSAVNDALRSTLANYAENFWYFNNGITIICKSISKGLAGSPGRLIGIFNCEGVSVVNGAQTVGTIGSFGGVTTVAGEEDVIQSWVQVRIISLEMCPPEFGRAITRAANLQNAVGYREFAAMDPIQHHLATDFALDRKKYSYKQGEPDPKGDEGCSIVEATQALACSRSVNLAVQVKREIGAIWADTSSSPYTDLFNTSLTTADLWRDIQIMRIVDDELQKLRSSPVPRADMVGIHLNRIILYLVFQDETIIISRNMRKSVQELNSEIRQATNIVFSAVAQYLQTVHEYEYLASLCKNMGKCEALVNSIKHPADHTKTQGSLFD